MDDGRWTVDGGLWTFSWSRNKSLRDVTDEIHAYETCCLFSIFTIASRNQSLRGLLVAKSRLATESFYLPTGHVSNSRDTAFQALSLRSCETKIDYLCHLF